MYRPWAELIAESRKCQLLCANCHRIKTIENGDWRNRRCQRKFHNINIEDSHIPRLCALLGPLVLL
jgi:hypothetical protein